MVAIRVTLPPAWGRTRWPRRLLSHGAVRLLPRRSRAAALVPTLGLGPPGLRERSSDPSGDEMTEVVPLPSAAPQPVASRDMTATMHCRADTRPPKAREEMFMQFLPLAKRVAGRYRNPHDS